MSPKALSLLALIAHLNDVGWLNEAKGTVRLSIQDIAKLISCLVIPAVCPVSGSNAIPFSEYFKMLKTDNVIAHEINMEASARTLPDRVNTYHRHKSEKVYLGKSCRLLR